MKGHRGKGHRVIGSRVKGQGSRFRFRIVTFIFYFLFFIFNFASAEVYLKDVPSGHYAYDAVYDLVKQGITGGFPDGTYRGDRLMSRYELAAFLAKFARARNLAAARGEKLLAEIGSELSLLEYEREKERRETRYWAQPSGDWRAGVSPAGSGAAARYRLRGGAVRNLSDSSYVKIDLDTLDTGWGGARRGLVTELLVLEGGVSWEAASLRVTSGPGELRQADGSGLFPAEDGSYYRQPWRALYFAAAAGRTAFALDLISRSSDPSGQLAVSELSPRLTGDFSPFKLTVNPRFFYDQNGGRDLRLELSGAYHASPASFSLLAGLAKASDWPHGLYLRGSLTLAACLELTVQRLGSQYREKFSYHVFDIFDRDLADGSTSFGLKFEKTLAGDWFVSSAADYTRPLEVTTTSWSLGRRLGEMVWELNYQTDNTAYSLGFKAELRL
ncbi:MAG: S-layer homology domain-containing protein [Candidatus Saganbacteria bacterium]|nr:S-layer homology domain-containing protein [Candidatus Saganbacteria bacterium]